MLCLATDLRSEPVMKTSEFHSDGSAIRSPEIVTTKMGLVFILLLGIFSSEALRAQDAASEGPSDSAKEVAKKAPEVHQAAVAGDQKAAQVDEKAAEDDQKAADSAAEPKTDSLSQAIAKLNAQLEAQSKQIEELQLRYSKEVASRQQEIEKQDQQIKDQAEQIDTQRQAMQSLQQQVDQMAVADQASMTDEQKQLRSRLQTIEESIQASQQAESTQYDINEFPGSWPIPGSSAAMRIGGFVKMNIVESFDPIGSNDRFIVSSIPVPQASGTTQASLTVSQSRLNLELRDVTKAGPLRAFVEGDFAGPSNTFRLRHAFGQYKALLIGQTWSTFMDADARPEDLDFEGINGQILVRQPQIRYFPNIGEDWNLLVSLEDTNPQIGGGDGHSHIPDFVVSARRTWFKKWHVKSALLYRKLEGICDCLNNPSDTVTGWALSVSGRTALKWWDERDNMQFQVNYGTGYGRYVNDLGTLGGSDAVFDPTSGDLHALTVTSFYVALQKWWAESLRSNFNFSFVEVDNFDFEPTDAYKRTRRFSGNIIWSLTPRVDIGAELLYGRRWNRDNQSGKATQLLISATYRY